ncbi:hypothetical protein AW27_030005 [Streptomyces sp. PCS3-D2]|uniref:hypothetical protein n=1 Tax=Streptomyces sp. PCS3-D2 TaxID=1460244 RepID=UPI000D118795|nr:hypothetical protein [Streptomyces sp. PCS3-D2]WKV75388.1 hypothetical protein AW27_030005 [Streptomyces sp. PCS3-D2]
MTDTTPNATPPGNPGGPYGHGSIPGQPQPWGAGQPPAPGWGQPAPHPVQGWGYPTPQPGQGWGHGQQTPEGWGAAAPQETPQGFREWRSVGEIAQSVPGCLNAAVLLVPGTIPLLIMYSLVRSARNRAHRVFRLEHDPILDPPLSRMKKVRAVLAVLASSVFLIAYGAQNDIENALTDGAVRMMVAPWLLVLTAPLLVYLLMRWASVSEHARMRGTLRVPLITVAKYVGALSSVPLLLLATIGVLGSLEDHPYIAFAVAIVIVALLVWAAAFTLFSSSLVVRAGFGTGQIHKALPGLLTALLVWEFVPVGLLTSGLPPGPVPLALLFVLGGPITVTAVTWWEVHRLTTRFGVVLRP